mgnify:CR=1 FL=1|tara:strand:+ start:31 stop:1260 length:1230 start_codon:yes stop_codon:yes gene_type:complete
MAVTESRALYNPKVEALAEQYASAMGQRAAKPFTAADITAMAPQVAPQTKLQQQATQEAGTGIGAYQPYVMSAASGLGAAGTQLTGAQAGLGAIGTQYADPTVQGIQGAQQTLGTAGTDLTGAQTAMAGVSPYITEAAGLTGTGAGTGAGSIASYMSPYQQQVIDTSLAEFDKQAAMRQQQISDQAVALGGFGGGREGVMQAEYQTGSDRNRAALQAQLLQQGFGQAQAARQADMASRLGIGQAQSGYAQGLAGMAGQRAGLAGQQGALAQGYLQPGQLMAGVAGQQAGMAGQRAQLAQQQLGIAGAEQGFRGADVSRLGQVGAMDQAFAQANIDAQREKARMGLYEPYERLGFLGSGLSGLMQGMGPQYQFATQPNPSPLATALGIGATGAGIYKMLGQGAAGFSGAS